MKQHPTIPGLVMDEEGNLYYKLTPTNDGAGYKMVTIPQSARSIRERVHRIVWEIHNGMKIPTGKLIRHYDDDIDNNSPDNLILGTHVENAEDRIRNGKALRGIAIKSAILNDNSVMDIKRRRANGESLNTLSSEYGVSISSICDITKGRTWKHIK